MAEADIELRWVTKRFGDVLAVDDVSFEIRRGEFFSLLGPSGCGKSTTLRMIAGFDVPTSGEVAIRGRVVNNVPAYRRETNMIFQQLALFPHLDVYDNVAFGLRVKRLPRTEIRDRVRRALEMVDLPGYESRRINQLSGGQQQRIAIARALVNEPAVLLLDEPLGALDLKLRLQMQLELKALQHRLGTTFVYVTHDQGEALTMSDRIAVMNLGQVEQLDTPEEIYHRPKTAFVATFIGDTNLLEAEVEALDGDACVVRAGALRFPAPRDGVQPGERVAVSIRPERVRIGRQLADNLAVARGHVRDATFMGSIRRYAVVLPDGHQFVVQTGADDIAPAGGYPFAPNDEVEIGWSRESVVVIRNRE